MKTIATQDQPSPGCLVVAQQDFALAGVCSPRLVLSGRSRSARLAVSPPVLLSASGSHFPILWPFCIETMSRNAVMES